MRLTTTLAAAAAIAVTGATANAGGLAPVVEMPVVDMVPVAPTSSINSGYVVLGVLGALLVASGSF